VLFDYCSAVDISNSVVIMKWPTVSAWKRERIASIQYTIYFYITVALQCQQKLNQVCCVTETDFLCFGRGDVCLLLHVLICSTEPAKLLLEGRKETACNEPSMHPVE
jgi:hypothetical protein